MIKNATSKSLHPVEFIILMGLMTALIALSIDAVMPAFPAMAADFHVAHDNSIQLVITGLFLGLSIGTLFFGPLSDIMGRKRPVIIGLFIYFLGSLLIIQSHTIDLLMVGRILQGFGLAAPRTASIALTRDLYQGDAMARVMSFIMMVFIMVPVIAPSIGQAILLITGWRSLFSIFMVIALICLLWFIIRQPETLTPEKRQPFSVERITYAFKEVIGNRQALGYTLAAGLISGAFMGYLSLAQPIFQDEYHMGKSFPLFFASLAISIGLASFFNGRLVFRYGAKNMVRYGGYALTLSASIFLAVAWINNGQPSLWILVVFMAVILFSTGIMFGNLNALAMEPIGHVAGMGAAIVGACSLFMGVILSVVIEQMYHNTITPLIIGFAVLGLSTIITMQWANSNHLSPTKDPC